jgi:O-antigen/teichoic acid export membrane protein
MIKSRFFNDLLLTSFTQGAAILFGFLLMRILSGILSQEYFGLFMVTRRMLEIGVIITTLNVVNGIARYVSYTPDREKEMLNVFFAMVVLISVALVLFSVAFKQRLSEYFFGSPNYGLFVVLTALLIFSDSVYVVVNSYLRGKQEMMKFNAMQFINFFSPVCCALFLWKLFRLQYENQLIFLFILTLFGQFLLTALYGAGKLSFRMFQHFVERLKAIRDILYYSFFRMPSGFLQAIVLGIPVFFSARSLGLAMAGFMGIGVSIIKMQTVFFKPFNLMFIPKFAEIGSRNKSGEIMSTVGIVIDFIISFLPIYTALFAGLTKYIVILFFGQKYIDATPYAFIMVSFSGFYMAYLFLKGIIDGLFTYPYSNIITFAGTFVSGLISFVFSGSAFGLSYGLGIGIMFMGILSVWILIRKANISFKAVKFIKVMIASIIIFAASFPIGSFIDGLFESLFVRMTTELAWRMAVMVLLFKFYLTKDDLWISALMKRVKTRRKMQGIVQ